MAKEETKDGLLMNGHNISVISDFYTGRCVFITGVTGFVGKVLLEKLLRSCTGIKHVYVLMRSKNEKSFRQRLHDLLNEQVFDRVRQERAQAMNKVIPISGDITLPECGVSETDLNILAADTSIVFHSAASVKFDEKISQAVKTNLIGTRSTIRLCQKLPLLEAVIHVSTVYSNYQLKVVEEVIYPIHTTPSRIIDTVGWLEDDILESITDKLLGDRPNTYTFTKALAETFVAEEASDLPVAIVRPSIVTAAWREPFPGWVDNLNGATGLIVASTKGVLRTMVIHGEKAVDLMPVDVLVNLLITVAWYTSTRKPGFKVYNCTSGPVNNLTWNGVLVNAYPHTISYPSSQVFRYPGGSYKRTRFINNIYKFFDHYLPAALADVIAMILGKKPRMVRLYQKVHKAMECLEPFTTREWKFPCDNTLSLLDEMNDSDREIFDFNMKNLDWYSYWEQHVLGARKFLLKEDPKTIPAARKNLRIMYIFTQIARLAAAILTWKFVLSKFISFSQLQLGASTLITKLQNLGSS